MISPRETMRSNGSNAPAAVTRWTDLPIPTSVDGRTADQMARLNRPVDRPAIEAAVRQILAAVGEDPDREGLRETPARVARAYVELFAGLREDAAVHLSRVFQVDHDELILVRDIEFFSTCEHHLLPFAGKAHIAYLPRDGQVVGLSKLARTVEVFARRPQVQERMTRQIADAIVEHLNPRGVAVLVDAQHLCMKMRGVRNGCSCMVTPVMRGVFKTDPDMRAEVLSLITNNCR
jgi:GTP cyclohydrolase I